MKKDLLIGGLFVLAAALGIGGVVLFASMQKDDAAPKTIKPKTEPVVQLPVNIASEPTKKMVHAIPTLAEGKEKKEVAKAPLEKKIEPTKQDTVVEPNREPKKETVPKAQVKVDPEPKKIIPMPEIRKDPPPTVKVPAITELAIGETTSVRLNLPDGEYSVKALDGGEQMILRGAVNTLKIAGANGNSVIDASKLNAREIIVMGDINGRSRLMLNAPGGTVQFQREINGLSMIDVVAPEGTVIFKSTHASIINGESKLTVVGKDVQFLGDINGTKTTVDVTLTKDGSLRFLRILGGVQLRYGKADAGDPEPRVISGVIGGTAQLRKLP